LGPSGGLPGSSDGDPAAPPRVRLARAASVLRPRERAAPRAPRPAPRDFSSRTGGARLSGESRAHGKWAEGLLKNANHLAAAISVRT
jgi:hypothetical protein